MTSDDSKTSCFLVEADYMNHIAAQLAHQERRSACGDGAGSDVTLEKWPSAAGQSAYLFFQVAVAKREHPQVQADSHTSDTSDTFEKLCLAFDLLRPSIFG